MYYVLFQKLFLCNILYFAGHLMVLDYIYLLIMYHLFQYVCSYITIARFCTILMK